MEPKAFKEFKDRIDECTRSMIDAMYAVDELTRESYNFKRKLKQQAIDIDFEEIKTEE